MKKKCGPVKIFDHLGFLILCYFDDVYLFIGSRTSMQSFYKLPDETIISNSSCQLEKLVAFREFLIKNGIHAQQSRINKYIRFLEKINSDPSMDPTKIFTENHDDRFKSLNDWFVYTLREVHELYWIYRALQIQMPLGIIEKLKLINSGRDFATFDTNSTSRNTQFELRITSYFCNNECKVDLSTETDIIVEFEKFFLYIECKRILSCKQLMRNIYEANDQLKHRTPRKRNGKPCYGIIAIDVTALAYPHQGMVFGMTSEHIRDVIRNDMLNITKSINSDNVMNQNTQLMAIWVSIHIPAIRMQPPGFETRFSYNMIFNDFKERKQIQAFLKIKHTIEGTIDESEQVLEKQKLTLRKKFSFPKGFSFQFNEHVLDEFFNNYEEVKKTWNEMEAICTAEFEKDKIQFTVIEFDNVILQIEPKISTKDAVFENAATILMGLFIFRFPYNEIGPTWLKDNFEGDPDAIFQFSK
jgi:hypothetical protein